MNKKRIIFHACDWRIKDITNSLDIISNMGYNYIQTSPVTPTKEEGWENWIKYQPISFTLDDSVKKDLEELCKEANKRGIRIVVDIVLRHLAGDNYGNLIPHEKCDKTIVNNPNFWLPPIVGKNHKNRDELINKCWGMPSLNYYNQELQDIYINFLDELINLGVYSFRLDMCKHYALPEEGCNFFTRVIGRYSDRFNYGECIDVEHYWLEKYSKYINVLTEQFFNDDNKLVTWIESHDTYWTFKTTRHMSDEMRIREWEILLQSHNNVLWFSRPYDSLFNNDKIRELNKRYLNK